MWRGPGQDPGGTESPSNDPPNQELIDLRDQFEQQQTLIAQLKEMLRKTEQTNVSAEKVEEYANTLSKMNARAKISKLKKEQQGKSEAVGLPGSKRVIDTPASEKINLLRKELEEKKAKLAERGKNQKGLEEMVTQLKAQFDDSQQLISQSPLNLSLVDAKSESYSANSNPQDLYNILVIKDKRITDFTNKIQKLEATVMDLQENLKEKDSVIDARTKAITLMSENLSKKGKHTLDQLDDTKEQMRKMQENFVIFETKLKEENSRLLIDLEEKNTEIDRLRSANIALENGTSELLATNSELQERLESQSKIIEEYKENSGGALLSESESTLEIRNLRKRVQELEQVNTALKKSMESPRSSPQRSSRRGKKGQKKTDDIPKDQELEAANSKNEDYKNQILELEGVIKELEESKQTLIGGHHQKVAELESAIEELKSKSAQPTPEKSYDFDKENEEIAKLKKQLDESNKNMIKAKAQHKARVKELTKKIDAFKKISDANAEIVKLESENSKLSHKIAELEEEKGNLQLKIVAMDSSKDSTSVEQMNELERKLQEQTTILSTKTQLISSLECQIEDFKNQICSLSERLETLSEINNDQVKSEMTSIHFEEQMDKLVQEKEAILKENEKLQEKIENLKKEKQDIATKLDTYMQENIELIDKLEKLSAEKVSSAESIEIVESLTQQEKLEIEAYQKHLDLTTGNIKASQEHLVEESPELNDSVNQLTEETSELLQKIELFTEERREVMEKMEILTVENNQLTLKIKEIENNRDILVETYEHLQTEKEDLDNRLENIVKERETMQDQIADLKKDNEILKEKLELDTVTGTQTTNFGNDKLLMEVEEYKALVEVQKQEITELKVVLMSHKQQEDVVADLNDKLSELQEQYDSLIAENDELKINLKKDSERVFEKDSIESELIEARRQLTEFEIKMNSNLEELANYKSILEENKNELINSSTLINELNLTIQKKDEELTEHINEVTRLETLVQTLNGRLEEEADKSASEDAIMIMSEQLQTLKLTLQDNIQETLEYEKQLQENSKTIINLNMELKALNNKILDTEHMLESKDDEIKQLSSEKSLKDNIISNLKGELQEKDQHFNQVCNDLKEKCLLLQSKVEHDISSMENIRVPLEDRIKDLENKNKEQFEKMKKIAANLKKRNAAYHELEQKYTEVNEKWETESKEKVQISEEKERQEKKITDLETKMRLLLEQFQEVETELTNARDNFTRKDKEFEGLSELFDKYRNQKEEEIKSLETQISQLSSQISQLTAQAEDFQNIIKEYETRVNSLTVENEMLTSNANNVSNTGMNEKDERIRILQEEMQTAHASYQTSNNALQAKIQELELFIETQEGEMSRYKERVNKLEEGLSVVEERRMSLERRAIHLGAQLQEKSNDFEKVAQSEDMLEQRLLALIAHDEVIEKRLQEAITDNQELLDQVNTLRKENNEVASKLHDKTNQMATYIVNVESLEGKNANLKKSVDSLESRLQHLQQEFDKKLTESKEYCDKMEIDLQEQLDHFNTERKSLLVQCEQLQDQISQYVSTEESLRDEILQYQQKLDQQQSEFENNLDTLERLKGENNQYRNVIEQLNLQIVATQEESDYLKSLLGQKDKEIESYQKQSLIETKDIHSQTEKTKDQSVKGTADLFTPPPQVTSTADYFSFVQPTEDIPIQNPAQKSEREVDLEEELNKIKFDFNNVSIEHQRISEQLQQAEMRTQELSKENILLQDKLKNLELQDNKSNMDAPQHPTQTSQVSSMFTWPEQPDDPFSFVIDPPSNQVHPVVEPVIQAVHTNIVGVAPSNQAVEIPVQEVHQTPLGAASQNPVDATTLNELKEKIKTLEYMLFTVEKEKEEALIQCHQLSIELGNLIYEKENNKHVRDELPEDISAQILQDADTEFTEKDRKQLQNIEFATSVQHQNAPMKITDDYSQMAPAVEEAFVEKTAYVCYDEDDPKQPNEAIEKQIIDTVDTQYTKKDQKDLHALEFTDVECGAGPSQHPVCEKPCHSQNAYLCYEHGHQQIEPLNIDAFTDNDDGWGWGPEEAKLEQEHREKTENAPQNLKKQIENLEERIRVLEMERENHLEEIKQSQIKSGKLLKKLKEFKVKNDQLSVEVKRKSNASDFAGLDDAIEEEFKSQINSLEKAIKEVRSELDKEKHEKEGLLKRIDVLTSANERMIDMKEKQDIEVLSWQQRNRELTTKLEQLEWGEPDVIVEKRKNKSEPAVENTSDTNMQELLQRINVLNDTIKDLSLDNEELQALLEEQRNLRIAAEKTKSVEPMPENMKTEAEYLSILSEKNNLNEQLTAIVTEMAQLQENLNVAKEIEEREHAEKVHLQETINMNNEAMATLQAKLAAVTSQLIILQNEKDNQPSPTDSGLNPLELATQIDELNEKMKLLIADNEQLQALVEEQRNLRVNAEKTKCEATPENMRTEAEYLMLLSQKNELHDELTLVMAEKERLQAKLDQAVANEEEIGNRLNLESSNKLDLQVQLSEKENALKDLHTRFEILNYEYNQVATNPNEMQVVLNERNQYYTQIVTLQAEIDELKVNYNLEKDAKNKLAAENTQLLAEFDENKKQIATSSNIIEDLTAKIGELQEQVSKANLSSDASKRLEEELKQKSQELQDLSEKFNSKEAEYEMKLYTTIEQLNQEWVVRVDQRGADVAENWKLHLESRENEFMSLEQQLRKEINELEEKCNALVNENNELRKNVDAEIRNEVDRISALQQQINDRQQYINELSRVAQEKQNEIDLLNEKVKEYESGVLQLNNTLKEKDVKIVELEASIVQLNEKLQELTNQMENVKKELEEVASEKITVTDLQALTDDNQKVIAKLNEDLEHRKQALDQNLQYTESLQQQLDDYRSSYSLLEQQLNEKNLYINEMMYKLQDSEVQKEVENKNINTLQQQIYDAQSQIQTLNTQLLESHSYIEKLNSDIQVKDNQLLDMQSTISGKENEYSTLLESQVREHKQTLEHQQQQYDELVSRKDMQINILETQQEEKNLELKELFNEKENLLQQLHNKHVECEELQRNNLEHTTLLDEENRQLNELREIIQTQVLKIEELKRELYEKSRDYDVLIAEIDIRKQSRPEVAYEKQPQEETKQKQADIPEDHLADPVSRAELDLALYMLHQRDVRCEELTVELMQLLEERDTLQLRLSNAIREKEELRSHLGPGASDFKPESSNISTASLTDAVTRSGVSAINLSASTSSGTVQTPESVEKESLATKLSELKTVGYRKDKTLVDEQELRRFQQLSIMQQHREDAAKLPAEAAARLVDASYTLSRDVQSPSRVLLNWLWGRSTPRVNDV